MNGTLLLLLVLTLAVAVGAFSQSVTGIGFGLVVLPVCALALPGALVVGTVARVAVVMDAWVLAGAHAEIDRSDVARLVVPGLCAVPVGLLLTRVVPLRLVVVLGSVVTLAAAAAMARGRRTGSARAAVGAGAPSPGSPPAHPRGGAAGVGFVSGVLGLTSGLCGPPLALYALYRGRPMNASRGTMAAFFLVIDALAALLHPRTLGLVPLWGLVAAGSVGIVVGVQARARLTDATVRAAVLSLVVVCALGAMIHSLW